MYAALKDQLTDDLAQLRADGLFKAEAVIRTPQAAEIGVGDASVLNLCANNYLGLADHPAMIAAAQQALDRWGFGMASVRFICGTTEIHKELERRLAGFLGTDDAILYGSCFDANGGLFETLLGPEDAVISDELNHASIIDGVRLCKAARYRYRNRDMADLEARAGRGAGRAAPADRHRRGVLDGRLRRAAGPDRRRWPSATTRWSWSTTRTPSASSGRPERVRRSCSGSRTGWTSSPARWARPSAGRAAATPRRTPRSWRCCGSGPGRTCSPTRWPRRSSRRAWPRWTCWRPRASCWTGCATTPPTSGPR